MQSATFRGFAASTRHHDIDVAASDHAVQSDMSASTDRLMEKLATTASSRDDDDMKGSDSWNLHSDASTVSSRVTTPDPQPPPISRPPLSSRTTETHTPHVSRTPAIPIPGALPPPPPPPRHRDPRHFQQFNQPRQVSEFPRNPAPGPNIGTDEETHALSQSFPLPDGFLCDRAPQAPLPHAFPPPPRFLAEKLDTNHQRFSLPATHRNSRQQSESSTNVLFPQYPTPSITGSTESPLQLQGPSCSSQVFNKTLQFIPWPDTSKEASSSEYSSQEDTFAYRNARQFPPQLPAQPNHHLSTRRNRSFATNRITNWVSEYEKSHGPARLRRQEATTPALSDLLESEAARSQSSAVSSHAAVEHLWKQLKQKRAKLQDIRKHMTQQRQELRNLRLRKDDADNAFMAVLRPLLVSQRSDVLSSSLKILDSRMAAMLKLREEYHFSEASYESLELDLDEEEQELSGLETKFFSILAAGQDCHAEQSEPTRTSTADKTLDADAETPYYLIGISADKTLEDVHPLYHKFSTAVGNLENAKEEYEDLLFMNSDFEKDRALREGTGRNINRDAEEFFAELPNQKSRMEGVINALESEVQRLRLLCEEKGAMKKFLPLQMSYLLNPDMIYEDMDLEDTRDILKKYTTAKHPRYSELLAQKSHLLGGPVPLTAKQALSAVFGLPYNDPLKSQKQHLAAKEYAIETLVQSYDSDSKADLVNRWILQQLRQSPVNALLLQSVFGSECGLKVRDYWRWQCDVLYYWWRDDTMSPGEEMDKNYGSDMSEYSARQGSPQRSRAASDGELQFNPTLKSPRHIKSSDILRFN
ncbi:hypothetical protein MAJ_03090, partial [Metarhizium majus ARSEF 297]